MATSSGRGGRFPSPVRRAFGVLAVLDDDPIARRLLCRALIREGYAIVAASASEGAIAMALSKEAAAMVVADRADGSVATRLCAYARLRSTVGIVVLGGATSSEARARLLDAGADDVVEPACDARELGARLRALLRRIRADGAPRLRFADLDADSISGTVRRGERRLCLTARELRLVLLFLRQPRRVLDRATILAEAWPDGDGSANSVGVHIHHLRRKLHGEGECPLLRTARRSGYILTDT